MKLKWIFDKIWNKKPQTNELNRSGLPISLLQLSKVDYNSSNSTIVDWGRSFDVSHGSCRLSRRLTPSHSVNIAICGAPTVTSAGPFHTFQFGHIKSTVIPSRKKINKRRKKVKEAYIPNEIEISNIYRCYIWNSKQASQRSNNNR